MTLGYIYMTQLKSPCRVRKTKASAKNTAAGIIMSCQLNDSVDKKGRYIASQARLYISLKQVICVKYSFFHLA
jgi:hypothetical protein